MNRHLLAAATLVLLPAGASAQNTAPVQITVLTEVQLSRFGITDFGPVGTQTQTYSIDPKAPTGAQQTARFAASGAPGATITVSWASTLDLCHETAGCGTKLAFTPNLSAGDSFTGQGGSTLITSNSNLVLDGFGSFQFWLGGSVTVNPNPTPGPYTGTFTLVATY